MTHTPLLLLLVLLVRFACIKARPWSAAVAVAVAAFPGTLAVCAGSQLFCHRSPAFQQLRCAHEGVGAADGCGLCLLLLVKALLPALQAPKDSCSCWQQHSADVLGATGSAQKHVFLCCPLRHQCTLLGATMGRPDLPQIAHASQHKQAAAVVTLGLGLPGVCQLLLCVCQLLLCQ
jgi:hypothetical protein